MKKKRKSFTTPLLLAVLLAGLSLLLYPTVSDYWNSYHSSQAIADYAQTVNSIQSEEYDRILSQAEAYNVALATRGSGFKLSDAETEQYEKMLNISGQGIMGYVEIPKINVSLPIYHGTDESILQIAVGHLEWSGLPVGGQSTHCVLSGHRGLPSAKLLTNLDKMAEGDIFVLRVLDEVLTYQVDKILIVEPQDTSALRIENGKDLCTLVTCTPYGINTHRLLIRGHRIENTKQAMTVKITAEANQIEPLLVAPVIAVPILLIALILLFIPSRNKKYKGELYENP